jgi:multicomponent Na+:H+ antiporter subunit E
MSNKVRLPALLIWLTTLWVALWGDLTAGNVASGLIVAGGGLVVARPTGVTGLERSYFRPLAAMHYGVNFLWLLVKSNLIVAWEIITPGSHLNRAIIGLPMHTRSAGVITLVANSITLTPGTVTVDVRERAATDDATGWTLFIHVLHFKDVASVRCDVLKLERLALKAFGARDELAEVETSLEVATERAQQLAAKT